MNYIDDLREVWNTLDTCFDRPEKYISEALDPVIKFRSYKAFDNGAIREFYSILRAAMMGARKAGLLSRLINDQTLPGILAKMPPTDWRQWAKERPVWMREAIEEAFWNFVDQKWRDALNVAAAEPPAWGSGGGGRPAPQDNAKKEATKLAKAGAAAVHVTGVDGKRHRQGDSGRTCVFKEVMGCSVMHPPWLCKVFGKLPAGEREKLIKDNRLCPFCLLHDKDKPCGAKQKPVACTASGCKGKHIQKLHDFLKDVFREESQVHMVHGDDGWEESEEAWELGEEEMMIVGTVQQEEDCSWQDACKSWAEQDEETVAGVYQVRMGRGVAETASGTERRQPDSLQRSVRSPNSRMTCCWTGRNRVLPRAPDEKGLTRATQSRSAGGRHKGLKEQSSLHQRPGKEEEQEEGEESSQEKQSSKGSRRARGREGDGGHNQRPRGAIGFRPPHQPGGQRQRADC